MHRLFREPLVHFLLLGALIFAGYRFMVADGGGWPAGDIIVTEGRIRNLAETFTRTWQRPPTPEEIDGLVAEFIREEVLYREALAMGLDRDDIVVRRRLRQKYEFISEDTVGAALEPAEQELAEFLRTNADRYRIDSRWSFRQVFLDPQRRGEKLGADAAGLLAALRSGGEGNDAARLGDSLMLEPRYDDVTDTDLARVFGGEFATALASQPPGQWVGPLMSGYGAHLIYIESRIPGRTPELAEVRDAVARDWSQQKRTQALESQYQALRARYRITIEGQSAGDRAPLAAAEGAGE